MSSEEEGNKDANGNDDKLDFGMSGYSFKMNHFQAFAQMAPRKLPQFVSNRSQNRGRNKTYCVLWGSGGLVADPEFDKSILVPFAPNGTPKLDAIKKILMSAGKNGVCMKYLSLFNMLDQDFRIFDLPKLGLKLVCLPDPRPMAVTESTKPRITIPLANDDNRLASLLLLAENDFDLALIKDIFGPVIVMLPPAPHPRNFKIKHLQAFNKSYLGLAEDLTEQLENMVEDFQKFASAGLQPMPSARRSYKKQLKGRAPPTDLLSHAPSSCKVADDTDYYFWVCGNPVCPHFETTPKEKLQLCAKCKGVFYCSATCQHAHWPTHKPVCKKDRKKDKPTMKTVN